MDMWSVGCIFAEALTGIPLFRGHDSMHQLSLIVDGIGYPTESEINDLTEKSIRDMVRGMKRTECRLAKLIDTSNVHAIDLLSRMLSFDPKKRISASEALRHPYFDNVSDNLRRRGDTEEYIRCVRASVTSMIGPIVIDESVPEVIIYEKVMDECKSEISINASIAFE
jgi:serine/threonine protein kinase